MSGPLQDTGFKGGFEFPWPFPKGKPSAFYRAKSYVTMMAVGFLSKIMFMPGANKLQVVNKDVLMRLVSDRSRPLVTVTNHRCNIDDPLMWTLQTVREFYRNIDRQRFTLAAHNICFTKQFHTTMFSLGRCVPCVRGEGIGQKGMDFCLEKMNDDNAWIHVFPEGRVTDKPIRVKWGIGRLILEASRAPVLLPIWVDGMDKVWPTVKPYYPRFGHTVKISIGDAIDTSDWINKFKSEDEESGRKKVADLVQAALFGLGERVGSIAPGTLKEIEDNDSSRRKYYP